MSPASDLSSTHQLNRIDSMFAAKRASGSAAMIFYVTSGFPTMDKTEEAVLALEKAGADLIELGIPFSDPIADGPTIQKSSQVALEGGTTVKGVLELASKIRSQSEIPLLLFSAYNPVHRYGPARFIADAASAGCDGVLIPDLPPEEGSELRSLCDEHAMSCVFLAAPTTTAERRKIIARASTGFIYYISLRGVTGARAEMPTDLAEKVRLLKDASDMPVAVGFGVSEPGQVRMISEHADGIVVGSALIDVMSEAADSPDFAERVHDFAAGLVGALPGNSPEGAAAGGREGSP